MQRCALALVQPGMVLAADVKSPQGQVLAGAGTVLSDKHLAAFHTWKIVAVALDEKAGPVPVVDPAVMLMIRRTVARRFSDQPVQHPLIQELFRIAVERLVIQQGGKK
jgi:hypothetical protein